MEFFLLLNAKNFTGCNHLVVVTVGIVIPNDSLVVKVAGIASILSFGFGIYVSIQRLIKNQVILAIDIGININPKKSLSERIKWKNIESFSEIKKYRAKIIVVNVNNPNYWIEKEENAIQKRIMKFNLKHYESPFNISASVTQFSHVKLMALLNENLQKYQV